MGRIRSLTHMSLDGLKLSRDDNPAAAGGETAKATRALANAASASSKVYLAI